MSEEKTSWKHIWEVNRLCGGGCLLLALGWMCWHGPTMELWWLQPLAGLLVFCGAVNLLKGCVKAIPVIWGWWRWGRYQRKGVAPRADKMARERDLLGKGSKR